MRLHIYLLVRNFVISSFIFHKVIDCCNESRIMNTSSIGLVTCCRSIFMMILNVVLTNLAVFLKSKIHWNSGGNTYIYALKKEVYISYPTLPPSDYFLYEDLNSFQMGMETHLFDQIFLLNLKILNMTMYILKSSIILTNVTSLIRS